MKQTLKHFFIPHQGNNYHPHILHTKRAIFYSGVFLLMKVIVVGFVLLLPLQVFMLPDVLVEQQKQIVSLTNDLRAREGLPPLQTETKLYDSAQMKVEDMTANEYFEHTSPDGKGLSYFLKSVEYDYRVAGENLGMGFADAADLVQAWIDSPTHYANLVDSDYLEFGVGLESGEYGGQPTVYVAQHFGLPKVVGDIGDEGQPEDGEEVLMAEEEVAEESNISVVESLGVKSDMALALNSTQSESFKTASGTDTYSAIGEETISTGAQPEAVGEPASLFEKVDTPLLVYNRDISRVFWREEDGKTVISAQAYIVGDVDSVMVGINHYTLELFPTEKLYVYEGQLTIFEPAENLFKVIITPSISIRASGGEVRQDNIFWNSVKVVSPTPIEKYTQAKGTLGVLTNIFDVSRGIYLGFIIFFSVALLLKIFIEIKKQHHHIIFQTLLLIGLLVVLFEV